jgi:hypothetical protein
MRTVSSRPVWVTYKTFLKKKKKSKTKGFREEYLKKTKNKNLEGYPRKRQGAKQQIKVQEYRKIKGIN